MSVHFAKQDQRPRLLEFLKNCIFRPAVVTGTLSWLLLVFTNFGTFIQYLAECKVTNTGTSQHCRQSPNLFQKFQQAYSQPFF